MSNSFVVRRKGNQLATMVCGFMLEFCALTASAQPEVVSESAVDKCTFVGHVEGSSGYGKNLDWRGLAKHGALTKAQKLGASHVVWEQFTPVGAFNGNALGKAYSCKS